MKLIKNALKVLIIVSITVVAGMLFCVFVYQMSPGQLDEKNQNSAKEQTSQMSIRYEYTGTIPDFSPNEDEIPEEKYHESVEAALKDGIWGEGEEYQANMDTLIKQLEGEEYALVFYRAIKNKKVECFVACKLKIKLFDGVKKYTALVAYPTESKKNAWFMGNSIDTVRTYLDFSDYKKTTSIDGNDKRFVWGTHRFENIYTLKVEGQEPTEVIPYEMFGKTEYFWYYEDLESDKPGQQLEYDMEVLEDYK